MHPNIFARAVTLALRDAMTFEKSSDEFVVDFRAVDGVKFTRILYNGVGYKARYKIILQGSPISVKYDKGEGFQWHGPAPTDFQLVELKLRGILS
jgi:hypothetical protein